MRKFFVVVIAVLVFVLVPTVFAEGPLQLANVPCDVASCHIPAGWVGTIPPNTTVSGDVRVNGVPYYDTLAQSGLVIYTGAVTYSLTISLTAEWGADAKAGDWLRIKAEDLLINGCGLPAGCQIVEAFDLGAGASFTVGNLK